MEQYEILIYIISGLAVIIPLVVKLIEYIKAAIEGKNWDSILTLVISLMEEAETQFDNGADRKQWVLGMIEESAKTLNYNIDLEKIGQLIDALCAMAKIVNASKK